MTDAYDTFAREFQSDLDRWEKEYDELIKDFRYCWERRNGLNRVSYRSEISEVIAELRQFS